jgi:putative transposase
MPRPTRIHVAGAFDHITLRGNQRQNIFFSIRDRELLNGIVAKKIERYGAPLGRVMLRSVA